MEKAAGNTMMELRNLTVGYHSGRNRRRVVVENLCGSVESNRLTCLMGRNGTGKSTLLRTMAALQEPLGGEVLAAEGDGGSLRSLHGLAPALRAKLVSVVLTGRVGNVRFTVRDIVAMGRTPYTGFFGILSADDRLMVDEAIGMVGMEMLADRLIGTLSDGERQKVMIARALAQQTPVMMLDEPTAFLDYPGRIEMMRLLRSLAHDHGKTIFLSTHDYEQAVAMADTIWLISSPSDVAMGSPRQLLDAGVLQRYSGT